MAMTRAGRMLHTRLLDARGWWMTLLLGAIAAAIRLPNLGQPNAFSFDETYYAKDAFSYLNFGYERSFVDNANTLLLQGRTDVFTSSPEFVVHPPLGKWTIALGEHLFGMHPFGWRIIMALLGIAAVMLVHRTMLRLTGNAYTAAAAGLFMAIDGMAIVLSRTALLDQTLMWWIVVTFHALVRDRDQARHGLTLRASGQRVARWRALRPWRLLAIVGITAAMATKWSALWFALAFAVLALVWDLQARRRAGVRLPHAWLADVGWVVTAAVIGTAGYLASWVGWFRSTDGWDRTWTGGPQWLPQALRALLYYHQQALAFHVSLTSDHPYKAAPYWWPLMLRPTSFTYASYHEGQQGCTAQACSMEVLALGNIAIWWTASLVILALALLPLARLLRMQLTLRDWTADFTLPSRVSWDIAAGPLVGVGAGWLPWIYWHERTTFTFYSIVYAPFMCMLAAYGLQLFATQTVPRPAPTVGADTEPTDALALRSGDEDTDDPVSAAGVVQRSDDEPTPALDPHPAPVLYLETVHPTRLAVAIGVTVVAVVLSIYFMPLWVGAVIPYDAWHARMWLPSWI